MEHGTEAQKYVWGGAIPLQIYLHESEVTTFPSPPPVHVLGPRLGYLPLLAPLIKPHFNNTLPPGVDTVWFDYKGLPLKWYIPTGVLFDLLCVEPERPWNLAVHFRGYPGELLTPCEDEDSVKWSFINSLKEAAYIINGNCKNIMNMSQSDQLELWRSVVTSNMEGYLRISSRLKLGTVGEACATRMTSSSVQRQQSINETDTVGPIRTGRIPVRLYVRNVGEDLDDLEAVPTIDSWDKISYINIPVEIHKEEGQYHTLSDALKTLLPNFFVEGPPTEEQITEIETEEELIVPEAISSGLVNISKSKVIEETSYNMERGSLSIGKAKIKLIRIQGIEPKLDIPFSWVANHLMNPDYFLHICVCVGVSTDQVEGR